LIGEAADNSCIPYILELVTFLFLPRVDTRGTNKREELCLYIGSGVMKTCSTCVTNFIQTITPGILD